MRPLAARINLLIKFLQHIRNVFNKLDLVCDFKLNYSFLLLLLRNKHLR
jgi:hypothetical protein